MIFLIFVLIIIVIIIAYCVICNTYENFIYEHSNLIKEVIAVNNKYSFNQIREWKMSYTYDNEHFFNEVSAEDYLIYQLQFVKKEVLDEMSKTLENKNKYDFYKYDIENIKIEKEYDVDKIPKIKFLLNRMLKKVYKFAVLHPITELEIIVELFRTNIDGKFMESKGYQFDEVEIENLINRLKNKTGDRYNDRGIWDAICRVERGKVSNKMRFAVYKRDNNRCRKCGRKSNDLEVDHIYPISKGGKSTFDNLQTLCRKCNLKKGDIVESVENAGGINQKICPLCGAPLKLKRGKYGNFYGCVNYPKCTYIDKK